ARGDPQGFGSRLGRGVGRLEPFGAGEAVRSPGVEHDRRDGTVADRLLRPKDRVGLGTVRREYGGCGVRRSLVDHERDVEPARSLESCGNACGRETLCCCHAHGATPSICRPAVSGRPSATFIDCTAAPAVPLTRLSMADTTTTRPTDSSTARPIRVVLAPSTSAVLGNCPSGSTCTNGSFA